MEKHRHDTSLGGPGRHFPVTEWTRLLNPIQRKSVLNELCARYWKPLYSYLRCRGYPNEQAKDLVQGFFTEKVIDKELVKAADRTRGRFRNLLLVALRNYTINVQRKDRSISTAGLGSPGIEPESDHDAEREFNRAWAANILDRVLESLKRECERKGKETYWGLFHEWLIEPKVEQDKADMNELCAKYGIDSTQQAYKIIFRTKARFREILRDKLSGLVGQDDDIDMEIHEFIATFSKE